MKINLGDFELISVPDGNYWLDGGAFFGVIPKVMWQKKAAPDKKNRVATGLNSVVVRTGSQTILIETGMGNKLSEKMVSIYGQPAKFLDNLSAAGIAPEDIDIVINSHLHFDHCGWNTVRRGDKLAATFPRAKYYVQEGEWRHAQEPNERDTISYIGDNYDPLVKSGQMTLLKGDQEIVPGVSVRIFPGHTRHMQAIVLRSGGKTACYISDLIPTTAHLDIAWVMAFDLFPVETMQSRKQYYRESTEGGWLTLFTHDPEVPWAYVQPGPSGKMVATPVK